MKRTLAIVGTPAVAALVLLGGAPAAQAGEQHHGTHADQRRHDRKVERRQERRAERAATPTTPAPSLPAGGGQGRGTGTNHQAPGSPIPGTCEVTADRAGGSFTVTNGCQDAQTVTVSIQSQPGPWHRGLCTAGGCHLLTRYDVVIQPGTHSIVVATGGACWVQVDLKWHGRLLRSNHYVNDCTPPVKPPVTPHKPHPRPPVQTSHHHAPVTGGRGMAAPVPTADVLSFTGLGTGPLVPIGFGLLVAGGSLCLLTRYPKRTAQAWREAQR